MAGLCEGGNEPSGSLKAICNFLTIDKIVGLVGTLRTPNSVRNARYVRTREFVIHQQQKAIIIDPTIRMERDLNQAHQVDHEKRAIYEPCIPYLSAKYNIPLFNWRMLGEYTFQGPGLDPPQSSLALHHQFKSKAIGLPPVRLAKICSRRVLR
ncbi:hypothetical protein ANN_16446 [Periplaneta americana]|uniref:Uncharacterized protein n=1 Tax=Periplaneta americana TaxID=6978 RepID=A0ABQ8SJ18_PERAM|nr:hypothetical protein ANN_16446 [Periplaneta americana]